MEKETPLGINEIIRRLDGAGFDPELVEVIDASAAGVFSSSLSVGTVGGIQTTEELEESRENSGLKG